MSYWLGIVSREHVLRGVERGIAQIGHGRKSGLERMRVDDWLIYYSPKASLSSKEPLQAFTAIGRVLDEDVWQADEGEFKPWRRRVAYESGATEAALKPLAGELDLTAGPNWGYQLRRGLLELTEADFLRIRSAMGL